MDQPTTLHPASSPAISLARTSRRNATPALLTQNLQFWCQPKLPYTTCIDLSSWTLSLINDRRHLAACLRDKPCHLLPPSPVPCPPRSRVLSDFGSSPKLARSVIQAIGPFPRANVSHLCTRSSPLYAIVLTFTSDSSTVSQGMGLQLQTLLNPSEESPSRCSVPDTPSSAKYPSGLSQTSQVWIMPLFFYIGSINMTTVQCSSIAQSGVRQSLELRTQLTF